MNQPKPDVSVDTIAIAEFEMFLDAIIAAAGAKVNGC
jgi:hypothetical protein